MSNNIKSKILSPSLLSPSKRKHNTKQNESSQKSPRTYKYKNTNTFQSIKKKMQIVIYSHLLKYSQMVLFT